MRIECRRAHGAHQLGGDAVPPDGGSREAQGGQGQLSIFEFSTPHSGPQHLPAAQQAFRGRQAAPGPPPASEKSICAPAAAPRSQPAEQQMSGRGSKTAFVTVGSTKFDALIKAVDDMEVVAALQRRGFQRLVIQLGSGAYLPSVLCVHGSHQAVLSHGFQVRACPTCRLECCGWAGLHGL